jgi:hypothetical protein
MKATTTLMIAFLALSGVAMAQSVPIGTLCSGNQTTWSSCPIPQPSGITNGQLIWESATSNGALSSNGTINTGIGIYYATAISATSSNLQKQLSLSSSSIIFYEYGLVQGTYCNIDVYYPTNYTQPYASILAIEENNASIAAFNQCGGVGDLGTYANNYIKSQTPPSLLGETAALSIAPAEVASNYTSPITIYGTGLMPNTEYNLVEASNGGSFTGLATVTSSSAGTFTASFPAMQLFNLGAGTYSFSLFNSNTGDISYATTAYTVSASAIPPPSTYQLTASSYNQGELFIMNASGQDLCTIDCYLKQTLNIQRGANLTLTAEPINSGYKFVDWVGTGAGSYSGTNQTMTITMYGDITEVANFMPQVSQPDAPPSISGAASALGNDLSSIFTGLMNTIINILKSL